MLPAGITDAFRCMVCGRWRTNAQTSVAHRSSALFDDWPVEQFGPRPHVNVTYCNNNPTCVAHATADGHWTGPQG